MLRSKKTAYVTIGDAAAAPAAPAAEGVDALACEQESAAIYAATEPLKSLVEVRSAGAARVLVVDAGTTGELRVAWRRALCRASPIPKTWRARRM